MTTVGINGFGRVGRQLLRAIFENPVAVVAAINDPFLDCDGVCYAIKYDSELGPFPGVVEVKGRNLIVVDGRPIRTFAASDPSSIPWAESSVQVVVDCSGVFTTMERAAAHMAGGAAKVIIAGPSADAPVVILGCNEETLKPGAQVISASSCTAVALGPVLKLLHQSYGVAEVSFTTIHSVTAGHKFVDGVNVAIRDARTSRSAAANITPTTTHAPKQLMRALPWTAGKLFGSAVRVPTTNVCLLDVHVRLEGAVTKATIDGLISASGREEAALHGILGYCDEPLVSTDFRLSKLSAVYDSLSSMSLAPDAATPTHSHKLQFWYNNERGYAFRLVDLITKIAPA